MCPARRNPDPGDPLYGNVSTNVDTKSKISVSTSGTKYDMNISAGAQGSDQVVDLEAGEDPPEFLRKSSSDPEVMRDVVIAVSSD